MSPAVVRLSHEIVNPAHRLLLLPQSQNADENLVMRPVQILKS
jgi:hypothetical protein